VASTDTTLGDRARHATDVDTRRAVSREDGSGEAVLARGSALGRYIVLERLGAGGMGVVYAALDPELDRRIALKLVRAEHDAPASTAASDGAARLLREAQAMARLHHPNVIVVHDVGTVDGRVFIAMEYLDGGTLAQWLDAAPRSIAEILACFLDAGAGLAAAHAAGIVHRDFKPDNVLLGKDGRVCVVDFGLARAASDTLEQPGPTGPQSRSGDSLEQRLTRTGALMGTPAYMSPEQHAGGGTDARSDQFAFCVALYEALHGRRPFAGDDAASLAANVLDGTLRAPPENSTAPRWLTPILARGLATAPQQRFADIDALLTALRDDPTVRRRRRLRRAAIVVAGSLAVAATVMFADAQDRRCTSAEQSFATVWNPELRARAEAAFAGSGRAHGAQTWQRTALELDDYAAAWIAAHTDACMAATVRGEQSQEMLDRRMSCLERRRREVEATVALFTTADAQVVDRAARVLGQIDEVATCNDSLALLADVPPPPTELAAEVEDLRGQLDRVKLARTAGRYQDVSATLDGLDARVHAVDYGPLLAEFLVLRGAAALDDSRPVQAEPLFYAAAKAAARSGHRAIEPAIWLALVRLVATFDDRPLELPPLVEAAEVAVVRAGDLPRDRGALKVVLGTRLVLHGEFTRAEPELREAVRLLGEAHGAEHPDTLEARELLALALHGQQRYDEAEELLLAVAEAIERTLGPTHPRLGPVIANLARVYAERGQLEQARASYERALVALVEGFGPEHQVVASGHANLATTLRKLGRYDEAAVQLDRALAIEIRHFGAESPRIAANLHGRGQLAMARGRPRDALPDYREALRIWTKTVGPEHARLAYALTGIGEAELALGDPAAAITALERALQLREASSDVAADDLAETRSLLARARSAAGASRQRPLHEP
jgi:eukaryotic-like serine/threonine-protein kinase